MEQHYCNFFDSWLINRTPSYLKLMSVKTILCTNLACENQLKVHNETSYSIMITIIWLKILQRCITTFYWTSINHKQNMMEIGEISRIECWSKELILTNSCTLNYRKLRQNSHQTISTIFQNILNQISTKFWAVLPHNPVWIVFLTGFIYILEKYLTGSIIGF